MCIVEADGTFLFVAIATNPTVVSGTDADACDADAQLVRQGEVDRCVCNPGYTGNGLICEGNKLTAD